MPRNSSAEQLQCCYPQWHPFQILGKPSTSSYGDSELSWCPATRLGDAGFAANGDGYISFAWNPSVSFEEDGFTEFIELGFPTAVYAQSIEIGEPRGMGSIVRIKAFHPLERAYFTIWESPDAEGDPTIQYRYQQRNEYRVFRPDPICQSTFKTDTLRIEMDTRRVTDWNELDYVQLTGSLALPHAALPYGISEVIYVPNPDACGADAFSYTISDCPFDPRRQPIPATVSVSITPVNDAPVARDLTIDLISQNGTKFARVDLAKLATDVDRDELIYSVSYIRGDVTASLEGSTLIIHAPGADRDFEIGYAVTDTSDAKGTASILHFSLCPPGTYVASGGGEALSCLPCPPGDTYLRISSAMHLQIHLLYARRCMQTFGRYLCFAGRIRIVRVV
jgi:hypothetical protein